MRKRSIPVLPALVFLALFAFRPAPASAPIVSLLTATPNASTVSPAYNPPLTATFAAQAGPTITAEAPVSLLQIPSDPAAAAAYLADRAMSQNDGPAAVNEILARAGIPVISMRNGTLQNKLAPVAMVDTYVYDFQVPIIAEALSDQRTWTMQDASEFAAVYGYVVNGRPIQAAQIAGATKIWVQDAINDPTANGAFIPLVTRELGLRHRIPQDLTSTADVVNAFLDPLQFAMMLGSLLSRQGLLENKSTGDICEGLAKQIDDPTGTIKKYGVKEPLQMALQKYIEAAISKEAADALKTVMKDYDMVADGLAIGLLLAGLKLDVRDDAQPAAQNAHYAHKDFAPENFYNYIAALSFDSPFPDEVIQCAGLGGVKLPKNGRLPDWMVKWNVEQDRRHVAPASSAESGKIDTSGGAGVLTDGKGEAKLLVEVAEEPGCPSEPSCGKGVIKTGTATGVACVDTTDLPIKLSDLLPGLSGTWNPSKPIGKLILDMIKRMALPCGRDPVAITWHHPDTFELTMRSTVTIVGKEDTVSLPWTAKATIHFDDKFKMISSEGEIKYDSGIAWSNPRCAITPTPATTARLRVLEAQLQQDGDDLNPNPAFWGRSAKFPKFNIRAIHIKLDPGSGPTYNLTGNCPTGTFSRAGLYTWDQYWKIRHMQDGARDRSGYVFDNWKITNPLSGLFDEPRPQSCQGSVCISEKTIMELRPVAK